MIPTKRSIPVQFTENGQTDVRLPRNFLEKTATLRVPFTDTISVNGTTVRPRGGPIKRISIIANGGKTLHQITLQDAINKAEIYEQTALSLLVSPLAAATVGAQTGVVSVPLFYQQPFADGEQTHLPTWAYDDLIMRIEWGGHAECVVGGTGVVTCPLGATLLLDGIADIPNPADPLGFARAFDVSVDRSRSLAIAGASSDNRIEVPTTAPIRAILVKVEDANGEPTNTPLQSITLLQNNTFRVYNAADANALRTDNARVFGVAMPPGCYVLEFAEDKDASRGAIYRANDMSDVDLLVTVGAACTVRAHFITIEPSPLGNG